MLSALLIVLLGAPEADAAQMLKIAYASQYEWKEDDVKNVTLGFTYTWEWGDKPGSERVIKGTGQVVVVGDQIVRRHFPDFIDAGRRVKFQEDVDWVVRRFVRTPFDELFKEDATFSAPEKTALGTKVVANGRTFYIKKDRIARMAIEVGTGKRKQQALLEFEHGEIGGGYGILKEKCSYTRNVDKLTVAWERELATAAGKTAPVPLSYSRAGKMGRMKEKLTIDFDRVSMDTENPVVLEPATRDLFKAAWERRYTLPSDVRIEGEFTRRIDKDLDKAGWTGRAAGDFQVWGMDKIEAVLDERLFSRQGPWRTALQNTCKSHVVWIFHALRGAPFDDEFANCGFELVPQGKEQVVQVYGYSRALAFKLAGDAIVGKYEIFGGKRGWWEYRVKRTGDDRFLIDRMTREVDDEKFNLDFRYARTKGLQIPRKVDVLGLDATGRLTPGTAEYSFRKMKVSVPKSG